MLSEADSKETGGKAEAHNRRQTLLEQAQLSSTGAEPEYPLQRRYLCLVCPCDSSCSTAG